MLQGNDRLRPGSAERLPAGSAAESRRSSSSSVATADGPEDASSSGSSSDVEIPADASKKSR